MRIPYTREVGTSGFRRRRGHIRRRTLFLSDGLQFRSWRHQRRGHHAGTGPRHVRKARTPHHRPLRGSWPWKTSTSGSTPESRARPDEVARIIGTELILGRLDDPATDVSRETALPNHWFGAIPESQHDAWSSSAPPGSSRRSGGCGGIRSPLAGDHGDSAGQSRQRPNFILIVSNRSPSRSDSSHSVNSGRCRSRPLSSAP